MFINISDSKEAANKGSSGGLVHTWKKRTGSIRKTNPNTGSMAGR
ncbi:hypothetical protein [Mucilaginibacter phenanthrenivorans]|nr:hypothetical protein [Mucilaginibacter phenanthrenivorans]